MPPSGSTPLTCPVLHLPPFSSCFCLTLLCIFPKNSSPKSWLGSVPASEEIPECRAKNAVVGANVHITDEGGQPIPSPSWFHLRRRVVNTITMRPAQRNPCKTHMHTIYRSLCRGFTCLRHCRHISEDSYPSISAVCLQQRNELSMNGLPASFSAAPCMTVASLLPDIFPLWELNRP